MNTSGIGANSWLTSYDPADPSTLAALLNPNPADPSQSDTPAGSDVLTSTSQNAPASGYPNQAGSGPSSYQQALDALTVTSDTFLIQSALGQISGPPASDSLSAALEAAEQAQASEHSAQSQAALAAAQAALGGGQTIDTTA